MPWEAIDQAITSFGADILFGTIVLVSFGLLVLLAMFFLLAVRGAWRWISRLTWNDVVRSAYRKAMR